jgi:hypothetical protein
VTEPVPTEPMARTITHDWLRYLGFTDEQVALSDAPPVHTDECEFEPERGWQCFDENLRDQHPVHTAAYETAELVMFVLEHAEVSRLTSALSTAEQERDEALKKANVRVTMPEVFGYELGHDDATAEARTEVECLRAELERTREVVRVAELIVDSWRNSSPHGPIRDLIAAVDALRTDKEGADG